MASVLLPDALWDLVEPLLPVPRPRPNGGRPRIPDRGCLTGILFVPRSGIPWHMLPKELGCGSGMTCWRRLRDWQQAGIWDLMHFRAVELAGAQQWHRMVTRDRRQLFRSRGVWWNANWPKSDRPRQTRKQTVSDL